MSDTDYEATAEFTVPQLTAIVAKLKKKLARFEYRLETKILHEKIASQRAYAVILKAQEDADHARRVDAYNKAQEAKKNMPGATIPIAVAKNMPGTTIPITVAKKIARYTIGELQDFGEFIIDGIEYGINVRGDIIDTEGEFIGYYDRKTKKLLKDVARPADWNEIMPGGEEEVKKNMPGTTIPIALAKKIASYTIDQLQDFNEYIIDGIEYGINIRGDVVNTDGIFIGHYDEKTKKLLKGVVRPVDWNKIMTMA